ncbi:MAG: hypothetical protein RRE21_02050 [Desulfurococcales archaeon]|nr:hypothetical protein [Desulfurococcales archaeon]
MSPLYTSLSSLSCSHRRIFPTLPVYINFITVRSSGGGRNTCEMNVSSNVMGV